MFVFKNCTSISLIFHEVGIMVAQRKREQKINWKSIWGHTFESIKIHSVCFEMITGRIIMSVMINVELRYTLLTIPECWLRKSVYQMSLLIVSNDFLNTYWPSFKTNVYPFIKTNIKYNTYILFCKSVYRNIFTTCVRSGHLI